MDHSQIEALKIIIKSIEEQTDIMLQAIRVDAFDIFEEALNKREKSLLEYQSFMQINRIDALNIDWIREFQVNFADVNELIVSELVRFEAKLRDEALENRIELNKLSQNQKKTNQYQFRIKNFDSGNHFDRKR